MAYNNINISEGIGTTINVVIKGAAQIVAGTADQALSASNGLTELLAVGVVLAAVVFVLVKGREAVYHGSNLM